MGELTESVGVGEIASDPHRVRGDARMLRRLMQCPIYVPNDTFRHAAEKMQAIVDNDEYDPRARVAAQKAILDMMKLNLAVRESVKEKPAEVQNHLHLHEIPTEELLRIKRELSELGSKRASAASER